MTEETLFAAALEKGTPTERAAFLDDACSGDVALRRRVEALLQSHEHADFLQAPAVNRPAEHWGGAQTTAPEADPIDGDDAKESFDFLAPSEKPGSLGRLAHYEALEVIGRGGMGIVLRAFDDQLHRIVAIKVMAPSLPTNGAARKRFVREARAAAAIRNEHVTAIYAVEEAAAVPYLVMEYIAGVSLQERLNRSGPLEVKEVLRIGFQTACGLAAAHQQGLVHRDIKPANILLENHVERVKITDFGLARARADASLTQEGVVAGTPQYMAPEQARGEVLDHRADLFSLGSVLYALCTGRPPFRADNTIGVLKRVCEDTPRPIQEINPDVPGWLVAIIARLQAKDPAERFQTAQEVADVLGRELAAVQRGPMERPPPAPPAKRLRRPQAVAAGVFLLFAAGLVLAEFTGMTNLAATVAALSKPAKAPLAKVDNGKGQFAGPTTPGGKNDTFPAKAEALALVEPLKPFVVSAGEGKHERNFATLIEAAAAAPSGDIIEIRGDGPFVNPPLELDDKDLTIRAGTGFRPVLRVIEPGEHTAPHFWTLRTRGLLVLEGLEFHVVGHPRMIRAVQSDYAPLWMANCRFILKGASGMAVAMTGSSPILQVHNCHFLMEGGSFVAEWECPSGGQLTAQGNVMMGAGGGLFWTDRRAAAKDVVLRLNRNTISAFHTLGFGVHHLAVPVAGDGKQSAQPYRVETSENLLDTNRVFSLTQHQFMGQTPSKRLSVVEADGVLPRLVDWRERANGYGGKLSMPWQFNTSDPLPLNRWLDMGAWQKIWGLKETASLQGRIRYRSAILPSQPGLPIERLLDLRDFRLAGDSLGKGAGEGGRDLGADVDLVGPGPAYERWKKTPAYQQWLKETGQKK